MTLISLILHAIVCSLCCTSCMIAYATHEPTYTIASFFVLLCALFAAFSTTLEPYTSMTSSDLLLAMVSNSKCPKHCTASRRQRVIVKTEGIAVLARLDRSGFSITYVYTILEKGIMIVKRFLHCSLGLVDVRALRHA